MVNWSRELMLEDRQALPRRRRDFGPVILAFEVIEAGDMGRSLYNKEAVGVEGVDVRGWYVW